MASQFEAHLHRLRRGLSTVEYVYMTHDRWPLPRRQSLIGSRLNISVLDSSFNPPTLAHLALAETPFPKQFKNRRNEGDAGFQAKLLLLSVRNADKLLKPSDATYAQRLEMMILLAKDLTANVHAAVAEGAQPTDSDDSDSNVAVAIIDEPTFVGKSNALLTSLRERIAQLSPGSERAAFSMPVPALTFLVGMDTLDRLFAPRYYPSVESMHASLQRFLSADGDDSRVICARRLGLQEEPATVESRTLASAKEFVEYNRIALVNLDEAVATFSSSEVRDKISGTAEDTWTSLVTQSIADFIVRNKLYLHLTS